VIGRPLEPGRRLYYGALTFEGYRMLKSVLTAVLVLGTVTAASATSLPDTPMIGTIGPVAGHTSNPSNFLCGTGTLYWNGGEFVPMTAASTFQRSGGGKKSGIISFGDAGLYYANTGNIESWGGAAVIVFSDSHDGTLQFDTAPVFLTGSSAGQKDSSHTSLNFTGYVQSLDTSAGIDTVTVNFTVQMPSCTVPVTGIYHAPK